MNTNITLNRLGHSSPALTTAVYGTTIRQVSGTFERWHSGQGFSASWFSSAPKEFKLTGVNDETAKLMIEEARAAVRVLRQAENGWLESPDAIPETDLPAIERGVLAWFSTPSDDPQSDLVYEYRVIDELSDGVLLEIHPDLPVTREDCGHLADLLEVALSWLATTDGDD